MRFPVTTLFDRNPDYWTQGKTNPDWSVFYPRICHCVCRGNPKGLSQRSHLFRKQAWRSSRLKGSMERSAGISWGSHCNALCSSPFGQNSSGAWCMLPGQAGLFTLGRTFNPAQPWSLTAHVCFNCSYLFPSLPSFWSQLPPFAQTIDPVRLHPFPTFSQNKCDPQLCQEEREDSSLLLCLYSLPLIAPWTPVRQCQGRTTS